MDNINIATLKLALEDLKSIPQSAIVERHPEAEPLSDLISERTAMAEKIITEIIEFIENKLRLEYCFARITKNNYFFFLEGWPIFRPILIFNY